MLYYLDGHEVRTTDDADLWGQALRFPHHVAETTVDGVYVSTIFLPTGVDPDDDPPVLFETVIFRGKRDKVGENIATYTTYDEAIQGHNAVVQALKTGGELPA